MKKTVIFIVFLIIETTFLGCNKTIKNEVKVVPAEQMQTLLQLDNVQLIDVRTPKEFKESHIDNAQNIDLFSPNFEEDINKLNKNKPVIIYCQSGKRSGKSTKKFLEAGFTKIYDLEGGIIAWKSKGFKVKTNL